MTTNNKKYGVTNHLDKSSRIGKYERKGLSLRERREQRQPKRNKVGEKIGATGLSLREQKGALQDMRFVNLGQLTSPKKKSKKSFPGERMMMNKGGKVSDMPKAKPC